MRVHFHLEACEGLTESIEVPLPALKLLFITCFYFQLWCAKLLHAQQGLTAHSMLPAIR